MNIRYMRYLCWTGGYDSTFRLLYIISILQEEVTPIYVCGSLDHIEKNNKPFSRDESELKIIEGCLESIKLHFSDKEYNRIHPVQLYHIDNFPLTSSCKVISRFLFDYGLLRRPLCQFSYLLALTNHLQQPLEIGYLRTDRFIKENTFLFFKNAIDYANNGIGFLELPSDIDEKGISMGLRFPLLNYGKLELMALATRYHWTPVLNQTKSCWYHTNVFGKSLEHQRCPQCRYIRHYKSAGNLKNELHRELLTHKMIS